MSRSRVPLNAAVLGLALALAGPAAAQAPEELEATNYRVVHPGLATAGQPSEEALGRLKELGFRTVVNLRTESEPGALAEAETVRALGLEYVHVPVSSATFSLEDVAAVARVLDDEARAPVLLHCASANRVGAVWAVKRVQDGESAEAAIAEGRQIGLRDGSMLEAVERLLRELEPDQPLSSGE